jgi:hypothetical protein
MVLRLLNKCYSLQRGDLLFGNDKSHFGLGHGVRVHVDVIPRFEPEDSHL